MNSTTACVSLGVLAGIGAGGALGYLVAMWSRKASRTEQSVQSTLDSIRVEINGLRQLLIETKGELEKLQVLFSTEYKSTPRAVDTESEYLSTYESPGEDEEDFYDLPADTPETTER